MLFFFLLKFLRIIIRIFSENILIIILGFELKMFSIIPLISKIKIFGFSSKKIYFIFQTLGSIFFYFGVISLNQNLILVGIFNKIAGFPLIWFPKFLKSQNKIFLIIWVCFIQKVPLYFLINECLLVTKIKLIKMLTYYFILTRVAMIFRESVISLLGWNKVLHSSIKIVLIKSIKRKIFILLLILFSLVLIFLFFVLKYKKNIFSWSKFYLRKKINYILFFSLGGVPLFINVVRELILLKIVKLKKFLFILLFSLIIQGVSFIILFLKYFKLKNKKSKVFLNRKHCIIFIVSFFVFCYFIYGAF